MSQGLRTGRRQTRRQFLKHSGWLVTGAPLLQAPFVLAAESFRSSLRTVVIGCGGRGEESLRAAGGENLVAIVDIEENRLAGGLKQAAAMGHRPRTFTDYRKMFDLMSKEVDAVFVATPDHHHAPASMLAIQHGKHVFCEKPLCHDIFQARALARAAKKNRVTTMMGNQGHCEEGYRKLCEYIWAEAIGDVVETHSWSGFVNGGAGTRAVTRPIPVGLHWDEWLGPAPYREYHEGLHPLYWRYYWDFGTGGLGDWGCHNLDGVFWALKLGSPAAIECVGTIGGSNEKFPQASIICWDIAARAEMPALKVFWYDGSRLPPASAGERQGQISNPNYPPMLIEFEKKFDWDFREGLDGGTFYLGTKGLMHSGCYGKRPRLLPDEFHQAFPIPSEQIPRVRGSHFNHFLECCKASKATCADFSYAAAITEFLLLGHLAIKAGVGKKILWDSQRMRCTNVFEVNRWIRRDSRTGWDFIR